MAQSEHRIERFRARVTIERRVIAAVNSAFDQIPPLAALSLPAIALWAEGTRANCEIVNGASVAAMLRELSERLRIQSDHSRETLDLADPDQALAIETLATKIVEFCRPTTPLPN